MSDPGDGEQIGSCPRNNERRSCPREHGGAGVWAARVPLPLYQRPFQEIKQPVHLRGRPGIANTPSRPMVGRNYLLSHTVSGDHSLGQRSLAERGALQILLEVRNRFHSNERSGERERLCERYGAPGIAVESGKRGAKLVRE